MNNSLDSGTAFVPTMPGYEIGNATFADMRTIEDQIHWLYRHLSTYLSTVDSELSAMRTELEAAMGAGDADTLAAANRAITASAESLKSLIDQLKESELAWDVTLGRHQPSVETMRDTFRDVTVHGIDVDELAGLELTVDALAAAALNVRGLAVYGVALTDDQSPRGIN